MVLVIEIVVLVEQVTAVPAVEQVELYSGYASTEPTVSGVVRLIGNDTTFDVRFVVGFSTEKLKLVCVAINAPGTLTFSRVELTNVVVICLPLMRTMELLAKLLPMTPTGKSKIELFVVIGTVVEDGVRLVIVGTGCWLIEKLTMLENVCTPAVVCSTRTVAVPTVKKSLVSGMKISLVADELLALIVRLWPFHNTCVVPLALIKLVPAIVISDNVVPTMVDDGLKLLIVGIGVAVIVNGDVFDVPPALTTCTEAVPGLVKSAELAVNTSLVEVDWLVWISRACPFQST